MHVTLATEPAAAGHDNEDFVAVTPSAVVLLDGAGLSGTDSGCIHGVAWYTRQLGAALVARLAGDDGDGLADILADAIKTVAESHAGTCDLDHVGTPSATVVIVRVHDRVLSHLVLADSVLVIRGRDGHDEVISDNREAVIARPYRSALTSTIHGTAEHEEARRVFMTAIREHRNRPDGFWVAGAAPAAAYHALTTDRPLDDVDSLALLSDGAARLVDRFALATWAETLAVLRRQGPAALIAQVRAAERSDPEGRRWPRGKTYDDATAAYCTSLP
jgi:Protein phosphatase 2C